MNIIKRTSELQDVLPLVKSPVVFSSILLKESVALCFFKSTLNLDPPMKPIAILFALSSLCIFESYAQKNLTGYTKEAADAEFKLEDKFDSNLQSKNIDDWIKRLSARPHHVGSAYGKQNAEYMRDLLKSWGYDANIETYQVLFPTPNVRLLELQGDKKFVARLEEPALKEDATSGQKSEQLPVYNCWSPDGDVTAELVFVNYGIPADYDELAKLGIDVKGKIVIAKYGGSWRGIKPKVAQEHGAIGCIIYSDPEEDGYYQGDVYPKGAFKKLIGCPAWFSHGHADLCWRPNHARLCFDRKRQTYRPQRS